MKSKTVEGKHQLFFMFLQGNGILNGREGNEKMDFKLSTSMFHYDEGKSVKRVSSFVSKDEKAEFSHPASACDPEKTHTNVITCDKEFIHIRELT